MPSLTVYIMFVSKIFAAKVAVQLEVEKSKKNWVVLGPQFSQEGDVANFRYTFSKLAHFQTSGKVWLTYVQ